MGMNRDERGQGVRVRERRSPPPHTHTHSEPMLVSDARGGDLGGGA